MWKKHALAAAIAAIGFTGPSAWAQTADVRQEDRRQDRMLERREDRLAEQENEVEDAARAEVRLAVPRKADGTIDLQAALDQVKAALAGGAHEIQFRDRTLSTDQMRQLLAADSSFLADLAAALPTSGGETQVRLRGALDIRVQRTGDGSLRVRIERAGSLTAAEREALIQRLQQAGFDRVRVDGGRIERAGRRDGAERGQRADRNERQERAERHGRPERMEKPERAERVERPERAERMERAERVERPDRSGKN